MEYYIQLKYADQLGLAGAVVLAWSHDAGASGGMSGHTEAVATCPERKPLIPRTCPQLGKL